MSTIEQFESLVRKMNAYNEAVSVLYWDLRTGAPKKSVAGRSEVIGLLSTEVFKMSVSEEMGNYLDSLKNEKASLSLPLQKTIEDVQEDFELQKRIPSEEYQAYVVLCSEAESVWEEAREKNDFDLFQPYLEKIVETTKKFIGYWGEKDGNAYNRLLDQYEPDMTTAIIDDLFGQLKETIVPLVKKINEQNKQPDTSFIFEKFPQEQQEAFNHHLLTQLGYDFEAGRLDETVHPFAIGLNQGDVRITTRYDEYDFRSAIFGTIHECGHALYEQNFDEKLAGLPVSDGASMGIHESQSLFYEHFIGHHEGFWKYNYEALQAHSPEQFKDITLEQFLRAINVSKPSLIRIEADELTYPLHIMIRYEIEKELFNGELEVKDLPKVWNDKYEEYLGIRPENDAEGILQDVHWSGGMFGYFPSYALGYMYAAQMRHAIEKDLPNFDELCENGNFEPILKWLTTHVHQYGKCKKPLDIIQDTTGEKLNAAYLANYLQEKYTKLYSL